LQRNKSLGSRLTCATGVLAVTEFFWQANGIIAGAIFSRSQHDLPAGAILFIPADKIFLFSITNSRG